MDGVGQVADIAGGHPGHGDTAVLGQVDGELLDDPLNLKASQVMKGYSFSKIFLSL